MFLSVIHKQKSFFVMLGSGGGGVSGSWLTLSPLLENYPGVVLEVLDPHILFLLTIFLWWNINVNTSIWSLICHDPRERCPLTALLSSLHYKPALINSDAMYDWTHFLKVSRLLVQDFFQSRNLVTANQLIVGKMLSEADLH